MSSARQAAVAGTLLIAAVLTGCANDGPDQPPNAPYAPPYLERATVATVAPVTVRRTRAPRSGGSTDVRGVGSQRLVGGGAHVIELTDHGPIASADGGDRWRRTRLPDTEDATGAPAVVRADLVAEIVELSGGRSCRLRVTARGGRPQLRATPTCHPDTAIAFAGPRHALAVDTSDGCFEEERRAPRAFVTSDGARTWQRAGALPRGVGSANRAAVDGRLYVVAGACDASPGGRPGNGPTVAVSRDAGRHWTARRLPSNASGCDLSVAGTGVWMLCNQVLYRSSDAGRTWRAHVFAAGAREGPLTPRSIVATGERSALAAPDSGGWVLRSADGGAHWTQTWPRVGPCLQGATGKPAPLRCFGLPARLAPAGGEAQASRVDRRTFVVSWTMFKSSGYRIWRHRAGRWRRLFQRTQLSNGQPPGVSIGDVNRDGRPDVLLQARGGSGLCGVRDVVAIGARRATPLFHRWSECEVLSELRDGLLRHRETIGPCPEADTAQAHCYGGVRTTVRGWSGRRVVTNRRFVRCVRPDLNPHDHCRRF